jgi:GTP-binding protein EngB required for normal cell division
MRPDQETELSSNENPPNGGNVALVLPQGLEQQEAERARESVEQLLAEEARRALVVSVMGQTGVGKSSLINVLFDTHLETGAVKPTTKRPQEVLTDHDGHQLVFWDLPGIGEGGTEDQAYLELYRETLDNSDIVLWALHADSRAVSFDRKALERLLDGQPPKVQRELFSKISFVLTKADLATSDPWLLGLMPRGQAKFAPRAASDKVLAQKAEYFREALVEPFGHLMQAQTYNEEGFDLSLPSFHSDEYVVTHHGYMSTATLQSLRMEYPRFESVFLRLWQNYEVVPCSARYRFNLVKVMLLVLNRLGPLALGRFRHFLNVDNLDHLPLDLAKTFRNFIVIDPLERRIVRDVAVDL